MDRSFVGSMTERRESRKIVGAVLSLGQNLGLTTVAEGVESEEQAVQDTDAAKRELKRLLDVAESVVVELRVRN